MRRLSCRLQLPARRPPPLPHRRRPHPRPPPPTAPAPQAPAPPPAAPTPAARQPIVTIQECRDINDADVRVRVRELTENVLKREVGQVDYASLVEKHWRAVNM